MINHGLPKRIIIVGFLSLFLFSCGGGNDSKEPGPLEQERIAQAYLSEILSIMRNNALTRNEVDWGNLESEVNQLAADAKSIRDTYPAITRALQLLNTNHSFLTSSSGFIITYPSTLRCDEELVFNQSADDDIGYIKVDGFASSDATESKEFATSIQARIALQDNASITGWIVDLRDNSGGNMWPMIAGLGPLFEGSILGHFIDPDEDIVSWGYQNGASYLGESRIVAVDKPYSLVVPLPQIAVLSSQRVASSGEATLIAFKKQFNVRTFGSDSCGLSTANSSFDLSDGSILFLTTAIMADREQQKYGGSVEVDQPTTSENTMEAAVTWLRE
jgi:hypothetical protein